MDKLKQHNQKQIAARMARKKEILRLSKTMSLAAIGRMWGVSRQAIWQTLR